MAIGVPGCPELAACTASMERVRMVFMQSWSSGLGVPMRTYCLLNGRKLERGLKDGIIPSMATKSLMSVEEYLHTSFDGCDCEYVDGEIVERNMGELGHSTIQYELMRLLGLLAASLGLQIKPEIRIRIGSSRYRIPDIGVWLPGDIGKRI